MKTVMTDRDCMLNTVVRKYATAEQRKYLEDPETPTLWGDLLRLDDEREQQASADGVRANG